MRQNRIVQNEKVQHVLAALTFAAQGKHDVKITLSAVRYAVEFALCRCICIQLSCDV